MQITAVPSASKMVGMARILAGKVIPNPYGDKDLPREKEYELRQKYVQRALELLQTDVQETTVFTLDGIQST